jgi:hypothetical protein
MKTAEIIAAYRQARKEWCLLLDQLEPEQMLKPINGSGWTIKDVIAHLTWHEREMIKVAHERALVGSPWWGLPLHQRNDAIFELFKDRSLEGVLNGAEIASDELIHELEQLKDDDLEDASCFDEMPIDWKPWQVFASNMHEHYLDHCRDLRNWLERRSGSKGNGR